MPNVAGGGNQLLPRMTALDRSRFDAHGLGLSFTPAGTHDMFRGLLECCCCRCVDQYVLGDSQKQTNGGSDH